MQLNERPIVVVDVDETVNNLMHVFCDMYNHESGNKITYDDLTQWELDNVIPVEDITLIDKIFSGEDIQYRCEPQPLAYHYLSKIWDIADIYFVSATCPDSIRSKAKWLSHYFPFIPDRHFIMCSNKRMIYADIRIDDYEVNLNDCSGLLILMDKPWNQHAKEYIYGGDSKIRAKCWKDVYSAIVEWYEAYWTK